MDSQVKLTAPYPVYPPYQFQDSESTVNLTTKPHVEADPRSITRTPSPTPSEYNALHGIKEEMSTKKKIQTYGIIAVFVTIAILISVFHEKIIHALEPATDWLHDNKVVGPLIIIAILIILSYPPLFGHELVATLAGVTWGLPAACAIVAAGTLLGEIANYFTFKYACTTRFQKIEEKDISYGLLAHVVRKGGFLVVLIIRYSSIPPHFATVVFSTVGVPFFTFGAAAILSLPKQFAPVYIGYSMKPENEHDSTSKTVNTVVLVVTIIVTLVAFKWIDRTMKAARPEYIYSRRKARQAKALAVASNGQPWVNFPEV
ncbi:hypothetical protein C8R43DRAFT_1127517 [Mycena crocata]|nr:hypothetical protein C8R43DRAFT_1127517 [Mycena crocata]